MKLLILFSVIFSTSFSVDEDALRNALRETFDCDPDIFMQTQIIQNDFFGLGRDTRIGECKRYSGSQDIVFIDRLTGEEIERILFGHASGRLTLSVPSAEHASTLWKWPPQLRPHPVSPKLAKSRVQKSKTLVIDTEAELQSLFTIHGGIWRSRREH